MKCNHCNKEIVLEEGKSFCPYCGKHNALPPKIPSVDDFGDAHKIMFFDKCHKILVSFIQYRIDEGYEMKDMDYWAYENLQKMFDKKFWKDLNNWEEKNR